MTRTTLITVLAILGTLASVGCKTSAATEPEATSDAEAAGDAGATTDEETTDDAEAKDDAEATDETAASLEIDPTVSEADGTAPPVEESPADNMGKITEDVKTIALPEGWHWVSGTSPKGAVVSIGVPDGWIELPKKDESTLFDWGAPAGQPLAGASISGVVLPFTGELENLIEYNRTRLLTFATLHEDGVIQVGDSEAYEVAASWNRRGLIKDSVQLIMATGDEGIGFLCLKSPEMKHDDLRAFCEKIFATHKIEMPKKKKKK